MCAAFAVLLCLLQTHWAKKRPFNRGVHVVVFVVDASFFLSLHFRAVTMVGCKKRCHRVVKRVEEPVPAAEPVSVRWSFVSASGLTVRRLSNKPGVFKLDDLVVLLHLNLLLCGRELRHRVKLLLSVAKAKAARCQEGEKRWAAMVCLWLAFPSLLPGIKGVTHKFTRQTKPN